MASIWGCIGPSLAQTVVGTAPPVATATAAAPGAAASLPAAGRVVAAAAPASAASRPRARLARTAIKAVEERTPIEESPKMALSEEELAIAARVHTGTIACELGATVSVTPSLRNPGHFFVLSGAYRYFMHPVQSRTGAIRLEDPQRGALWLQLGNKSMLMNQKLGKRLADECIAPSQALVAAELKRNPPQSILEPLSKPASAPAPAASAAAEAASAPSSAPVPPVATSASAPAAPASAKPTAELTPTPMPAPAAR